MLRPNQDNPLEKEVGALFQKALKIGIGSGISAAWGRIDDLTTLHKVSRGKIGGVRNAADVSATSFYDLASLTKILATTSLFMVFDEAGIIRVESTLETHLPEEVKKFPHLRDITIAQLLSHTSGLPAWNAFYETMKMQFGAALPYLSIAERKKYFYDLVLATPLENKPGEKVVYSDLGFLILSYLAEKTQRKTFAELVEAKVWSNIDGSTFHFRPMVSDAAAARDVIASLEEEVVMTEVCPWRGLIQGQVHDDNAWTMGGVAGHAGVFGSLNDCIRWVDALFGGKLVRFSTLQKFLQVVSPPAEARRSLGFDLVARSGGGSTAFAFSENTVGHLGYTGTSIWIDLDDGFFAILLTNRVHPSRHDLRIRDLRQNFHTLVRKGTNAI
jgi:CubicO group peptidase (beta-lactamase class C family)